MVQKEEKLKIIILKTLTDIKHLFLISLILYVLALSIGIFMGFNNNVSINLIRLSFIEIFTNNLLTCLKTLFFGIISFGIGTTFFVIYNGINLGYILISVYNSYGWLPISRYILPHAIFELIEFLLFATLGYYPLKVVYVITKNSLNPQQQSHIYLRGILFLVFVAIVFLVCAAFIESLVAYYS
jgi:uncharacterized membrane protein SpoIIM required for sporulation